MNTSNRQQGDVEQPGNSSQVTGLARLRSRLSWKIFATILTVVSLTIVCRMLADAWPDLLAHRFEIDFRWLALGFLLTLISAYLTFLPFSRIVHASTGFSMPLLQVAHLYFTSQLLKHLPGRIWGIGYQWIAAGRTHSIGNWLRANILHMALATFFALASSGIMVSLTVDWKAGAVSILLGVFCYMVLWSSISVIRRFAGRIQILHRLDGLLEFITSIPGSARLRIFVLFVLSWLIYYLAWYCNGLSYPPIGGSGGMRMCALYMLAWFVGYVSLLTPSGLGVRELVFAWLAKDFPHDAVALMAVVARVNLLGVDVALGLAFAPFSPRSGDSFELSRSPDFSEGDQK